jgi:hypothetical protein
MKKLSHVPALAAAALTLGLGGCGGNSVNDHLLGGTVTGLTSGTLVLTEGAGSLTIGPDISTFNFPLRFPTGTSYQVYVVSQPAGLTCRVANSTGTIGTGDVTNLQVTCVPNSRLGGTISGLTGTGLVLANGNDTYTATPGTTSFFFPTKVGNGLSYGVTVLTQPTNPTQTCTVQNGSGIMGASDVTNVQVNCI